MRSAASAAPRSRRFARRPAPCPTSSTATSMSTPCRVVRHGAARRDRDVRVGGKAAAAGARQYAGRAAGRFAGAGLQGADGGMAGARLRDQIWTAKPACRRNRHVRRRSSLGSQLAATTRKKLAAALTAGTGAKDDTPPCHLVMCHPGHVDDGAETERRCAGRTARGGVRCADGRPGPARADLASRAQRESARSIGLAAGDATMSGKDTSQVSGQLSVVRHLRRVRPGRRGRVGDRRGDPDAAD